MSKTCKGLSPNSNSLTNPIKGKENKVDDIQISMAQILKGTDKLVEAENMFSLPKSSNSSARGDSPLQSFSYKHKSPKFETKVETPKIITKFVKRCWFV